MIKRGKIIWAPKPLIEFVDQVSHDNKIKQCKGIEKTIEYAKVGREIERILKRVGYL